VRSTGRVLVGDRQQDGDARAQLRLGVDPHVAPGLGHDSVDGRQAQTGPLPFGLGREERLERPVQDLGRHPGAVVADLERDVPPGGQVGVGGRVGVIDIHVGRLDRQLAATGHRVAGVDRQVDQDLVDVAGVSKDAVEGRLEVGDQLYVLAKGPLQQFEDAGDGDVEVQDPRLHHFAAGERQ
jgi:hypothetical protein